jgi:hypothetical protein
MSMFNDMGEGLLLAGAGQMEIARVVAQALSRGLSRLARQFSGLASSQQG